MTTYHVEKAIESIAASFARIAAVLESIPWQHLLADGAGTRGAITAPCAGAMTATSTSPNATATPPSAGGTVPGGGSVEAAVEALRVALAEARQEMAANADLAHEALRIEREACDAFRSWFVNGVFNVPEISIAGEWMRAHDARRAAEQKDNGGSTAGVPTLAIHADASRQGTPVLSSTDSVRAPTNQPTVTDEDLRLVMNWIDAYCERNGSSVAIGEVRYGDLAALIARVRHARDADVRELVAALPIVNDEGVQFGYSWFGWSKFGDGIIGKKFRAWCDNAAALVARFGGGK